MSLPHLFCKIVFFTLTFYSLLPCCRASYDLETPQKCQKISLPLCSGMKYNHTVMPNLVGHTSQKEAEVQILEFIPLVQSGCSPWLKFFLCSLYTPMCTEQVDGLLVIPACRSMCLKVKEKCEPLLKQIKFQWPQVLDCSKLPEKSAIGGMCIEPPGSYEYEPDHKDHFREFELYGVDGNPYDVASRKNIHSKSLGDYSSHQRKIPYDEADSSNSKEVLQKNFLSPDLDNEKIQNHKIKHLQQPISSSKTNDRADGSNSKSKPSFQSSVLQLEKNDLRCPPRYLYANRFVGRSENDSCVARCGVDVLYKEADKRLMEVWMFAWAVTCFTSTLLTFFTFIIKPSRFQYPQRPIIFLSLCCLVVSCGYILRIVLGPAIISCEKSKPDVELLIYEGVGNTWCIVSFLLSYYFGMAAFIWWVNLTISFYLSSARQWSSEAIDAKSNFFHSAAWAIPAIKTALVLMLRKVDADELTGTCYVGNHETSSVVLFVLSPLLLYLLIGVLFILAGFIAMFRIRRDLKEEGANVKKFDRLMLKIGIFSILYTAPVSCVIGCIVYSTMHRQTWVAKSMITPCKFIDDDFVDCALDQSIPNVGVSMLRIFMLLLVGTASGVWIWSPKTYKTWKKFIKNFVFKSPKENVLMAENAVMKTDKVFNAKVETTFVDLNKAPNKKDFNLSRLSSSDAIYHVPNFND